MTKITIRNYTVEHMGNCNFSIKKDDESISYEDIFKATDLTEDEMKRLDDFIWGPVSLKDMMKSNKSIKDMMKESSEGNKTKKAKALYTVRGESILDTGDSISWYFTNNGVLNIKQKYLFSKEILADIKKAEASGFNSEDVMAANELFTKKEAFALVKEITNKKIGDDKKLKKVKVSEVTIEVVNLPISISNLPTDIYSHDYTFGNDTGITAYGT